MTQKIYTKTGDKGQTSLIGGTRVSKNHLRIDTYGTVDELNSWLGLLADQSPVAEDKALLQYIQDRLFTIGSNLACDSSSVKMILPDLKPEDLTQLEQRIDAMQLQLPELSYFIIPGGHPVISHVHIARCVCRRAERLTVGLAEEDFVPDGVVTYLNRLSDFLFVISRSWAKALGVAEQVWRPATQK